MMKTLSVVLSAGLGGWVSVFVIILFAGIAFSFILNKKNHNRARRAKEELLRAEKKEALLKTQLEDQQQEALRRLELRKETHNIYQQVRNNTHK